MTSFNKWLVLGILSLIFGAFCLANAAAASLAVATVTGVLLMAAGAFQILAGLDAKGRSGMLLGILLGALLAFAGFSMLRNPFAGIISLSLLVTLLLAASGAVRLLFAQQMRGSQYFWPMLVSGLVSLGLAIYILANFSAASVSLLGILLGVELIFNGAGLIALAFFQRNRTV